MVYDNIKTIENKIATACKENPEFAAKEVTLIAVTKTRSAQEIRPAYDYGIRDFGENHVQEIVEKYPLFPDDLRWHLIGHLQTNKVKYIIDKVAMIHSLDSLKLAEEIEKRAAAIGRVMPCLVQVNIAEEETKSGLFVSEVEDFMREMSSFPHIAVKGLMTIGPHVTSEKEIQAVFRSCRRLAEKIKSLQLPYVEMKELSMGMTSDYELAVAEGATMVRVGTAIFGARA